MHWFEHDKAEEHLEALGLRLAVARDDLDKYKSYLSPVGTRAIEGEIARIKLYMKNIQELIDEKSPAIDN
jgi:hypothetical protein